MSGLDPRAITLAILSFLRANAIGILLTLGVLYALQRIMIALANRYVQEDDKRHEIKKWTRYITLVFAAIWVIMLYYSYADEGLPFYLFVLGLILAGVAISMRDVFSNFAGWVIIVSGRGFRARDRIKIGNIIGDVIDIGILRTTLSEVGEWVKADQSTGRLITIPNNMVLIHPVSNYTLGFDFVWDELPVTLTFESDYRKAEEIMLDVGMKDFEQKREHIAERMKHVRRKYLLRYSVVTPGVFVVIADSGVTLTLRYMVRARRRRTLQDAFSRQILDRFNTEPSVELAYPTYRIFKMGEGKA